MAEKKVSSKKKSVASATADKRIRAEQDATYEDFIAKFGPELRKRSTRTVNEPKKKNIYDRTSENETSRCGEIDPHTTVNPALQHQIMTKRTGRILSDDTGFKAHSYNQRFELTAEMPEIRDEDTETESEITQDNIPGQQTMAEIIEGYNTDESISVPIEGQISTQDEDPFLSAYNSMKNDGTAFGKSEKLRAIARTAADDAGMEPESQLTFPAFDPLFKFPEEDKKEKKKKRDKKEKKQKHSDKPKKEKNKQKVEPEIFDIEENQIVTVHETEQESDISKKGTAADARKALAERKQQFFDFLKDTGNSEEVEPAFEIGSKNEIRETSKKLASISKASLIKAGSLLLIGIILFIISAVFDSKEDSTLRATPILYSGISLMFMLLSGAVCIKEFIEGFKDFSRKRISLNVGGIIIFASALIQNFAALFAHESFPGSIHLISSAAIISLITVVLPKFFLTNNSRLTVGMFSGGNIASVFRSAAESGIDGALKTKYSGKNSSIRYAEKTEFVTGLMKKLTNAVPKPFGLNAAYVMVLIFSLIVGIASGIISHSIMTGITAFSAMVITCTPVSYILSASIFLYNTNNRLAKHKASLLSYRCASELTSTDAIIFDAAEIIEQSSCSIHGIKAFGKTDPRKSTLYCAAAVNAALSPLADIMKQVTDQSGEEVPVAEEINVTAFRGISATVENNTVLLGSREFLEENKVRIPDEDYEEKFITGDRKLLYLAVNGEFSMLLIVSYHIKRSVSAFLKYLSNKGLRFVIHSSDPNITPSLIAKKCKLKEECIFAAETSEAAYLRDKESRIEPAMPADVFTDGNMFSLSVLMRNAFSLKAIIDNLPFIVYACSAISALLIAAPILLGSVFSISNIYIIIIRAVSIAAAAALSAIHIKRNT